MGPPNWGYQGVDGRAEFLQDADQAEIVADPCSVRQVLAGVDDVAQLIHLAVDHAQAGRAAEGVVLADSVVRYRLTSDPTRGLLPKVITAGNLPGFVLNHEREMWCMQMRETPGATGSLLHER